MHEFEQNGKIVWTLLYRDTKNIRQFTMTDKILPKQEEANKQEYTFKKVQLFKNETLGTGGYGAVCKAKCDQLVCAAKLLYLVLFQIQTTPNPTREHRQPFRRFEQECQFLSRINHPNIVQYLGTYRDPETNAPVLLMELMDESLTHFLESSPGDIPYYIQVNLSQDIAQALAFLHANGIIHRDLSSNNVLLIAGSRAKVSDFGMSKFVDENKSHLATMTQCPGTQAFMSPEALDEPPVYTEKLDNFSFGVLLVQLVIRQFPVPTDRFETVLIPSPRDPTRTVRSRLAIPEVERRQSHISLIEPTHPLLPIALECLKDEAVERPFSQQLCESLDGLKKTVRYEKSKQDACQPFKMNAPQQGEAIPATEDRHFVQSLRDTIEAKDKMIQTQNEVVETQEQLIQFLRNEVEAKERQLQARELDELALNMQLQSLQCEAEAREQQLRRLNQQLESNEEITATLQETIAPRDREIAELREILATKSKQAPSEATDTSQRDQPNATRQSLHLVWGNLHYKSIKTNGIACALIGQNAYFRSNSQIWEFNSVHCNWTKLCDPPIGIFTLVSVDSLLTTVGGCLKNRRKKVTCSSSLYSYVNDEKWVEHFPPMPTKRWECAAAYANHALVVAGGFIDRKGTQLTAVVEVLNTVNKKWAKVSSLPFPTFWPSVALCGEYIYLLPGYTSPENEYSAVRCTFSGLLQSTSRSNIWEKIASPPVCNSTLVAVRGHLLAVGGHILYGCRKNEIYHYDFIINSWQVISQMSVARSSCCAVCLPNNHLMVIGGNSGDPVTEIASVIYN